jgi:hypothetical protein
VRVYNTHQTIFSFRDEAAPFQRSSIIDRTIVPVANSLHTHCSTVYLLYTTEPSAVVRCARSFPIRGMCRGKHTTFYANTMQHAQRKRPIIVLSKISAWMCTDFHARWSAVSVLLHTLAISDASRMRNSVDDNRKWPGRGT